MKNNRKIEVGQVRMMKKCADGSGWEDAMYIILDINDNENIRLKFITGDDKLDHYWQEDVIQEDIVVM